MLELIFSPSNYYSTKPSDVFLTGLIIVLGVFVWHLVETLSCLGLSEF